MTSSFRMPPDRMPPLAVESMDEAQRKAAAALIAGPRGGVKGPFIPLLRSPDLMDRLQRVGEYLRFGSSLDPRISEFLMLIVSREWTNHFEWLVHYPLALKNGVARDTLDALAEGRCPPAMADDEAIAYDVCAELFRTKGLCDSTYARAIDKFGERGLIDMLGVVGYFLTVSMVMNVAHTPPPADDSVPPLAPFPL